MSPSLEKNRDAVRMWDIHREGKGRLSRTSSKGQRHCHFRSWAWLLLRGTQWSVATTGCSMQPPHCRRQCFTRAWVRILWTVWNSSAILLNVVADLSEGTEQFSWRCYANCRLNGILTNSCSSYIKYLFVLPSCRCITAQTSYINTFSMTHTLSRLKARKAGHEALCPRSPQQPQWAKLFTPSEMVANDNVWFLNSQSIS